MPTRSSPCVSRLSMLSPWLSLCCLLCLLSPQPTSSVRVSIGIGTGSVVAERIVRRSAWSDGWLTKSVGYMRGPPPACNNPPQLVSLQKN
eukprot:1647359-Prymnesium_polylepis.1